MVFELSDIGTNETVEEKRGLKHFVQIASRFHRRHAWWSRHTSDP